jgi:hypothetical protein
VHDVADELAIPAAYARWRKDRRLALYRIAVERLRRDPAALSLARATLRLWFAANEEHSLRDEWEAIMSRGVEAVIGVLLEDSEHADDLRKCSPFSALVPQHERLTVLAEWLAKRPAGALGDGLDPEARARLHAALAEAAADPPPSGPCSRPPARIRRPATFTLWRTSSPRSASARSALGRGSPAPRSSAIGTQSAARTATMPAATTTGSRRRTPRSPPSRRRRDFWPPRP